MDDLHFTISKKLQKTENDLSECESKLTLAAKQYREATHVLESKVERLEFQLSALSPDRSVTDSVCVLLKCCDV